MVHLAVHSAYSLLEGTASLRSLVGRAVEHGIRALALTDTLALYGAVPFYELARSAGIHPIWGAHFGLYRVLVRDRQGYAEVCAMLTAVRLGQVHITREAPWPFPHDDAHLFLLASDGEVVKKLKAQGLRPLVMLTQGGTPAGRHRAAQQYALAESLGLRPVAVEPVYFLEPHDYRRHQILAAIRHRATLATLRADQTAPPTAWFRSPREMERMYAAFPQALHNAEWVADACAVEVEWGKPLFPEFPVPEGETPFSWLWKKAFEGIQRRYRPLRPEVLSRAQYELEIIDRLGFSPYFLIVHDLVEYCRAHDIPACGRGSAANSLIAYALGITRVDPLKYNLYFERFLNPARTDCPDIDLDVCWRRRDEVLAYIYRRYGADRVAMISTVNTFKARSAFREVARVYGLSPDAITEITRRIPHSEAAALPLLLAEVPECRGLHRKEPLFQEIVEQAAALDGLPRHLSIHAGGVVIAPRALTHYVPLECARKGLVITQYDMEGVEALGLLKMDVLGHRALSVLAEAKAAVAQRHGIAFDDTTFPEADPLTARLLSEGATLGCFQIESPAMRGLLRKVGAKTVHQVIQTIALVRPGASGSGMKKRFIARHHGREAVTYLHPAMETVLHETYGVLLYQEDVLKVAHAVGGMTLAEADALRRAMSKDRSPAQMATHMKRFVESALAHGVPKDIAHAVWELMANFAAYAYCKAHAATYGELAYQCAYLKAHYPQEFFAAVLNNRGGFYAPSVYFEEARRCGVPIFPVDVQRSGYEYAPEGLGLRMGFLEVRGVRQEAWRRILHARAQAPFVDIHDFFSRSGIQRSDAEILWRVGAFDGFGLPRPSQYAVLCMHYARTTPKEKPFRQGQVSELVAPAAVPTVSVPDFPLRRRIEETWPLLGIPYYLHPLRWYLERWQEGAWVASVDLPKYVGHVVTAVGCLIAERRQVLRNGEGIMKFVTLEDTQGVFEAVLFPAVYRAWGHVFAQGGPYAITGEVQDDDGAPVLVAQQVVSWSHACGGKTVPSFFPSSTPLPYSA